MIGWKDHLVSDIQCVEWDVKPSAVSRDAASLFFCGTLTLTPTPGLENLGLHTPTPNLGLIVT